ncbi:hypothetical protein HanIR_Chr05g0211101 [Helianthus annuus]|nr:hypothetical protein HanIR_Chr05g0211101 [Helianthus annuus]
MVLLYPKALGVFQKKIVIFYFQPKGFYFLYFNPFNLFTFNPKLFIFCNLTQNFVIYNFVPLIRFIFRKFLVLRFVLKFAS